LRLEKSENPEELNERLDVLLQDITKNFYKNICRGLFEKDKLLYSFLIAVNIKLAANKIGARDWAFF
jgi:dynein heavy chain